MRASQPGQGHLRCGVCERDIIFQVVEPWTGGAWIEQLGSVNEDFAKKILINAHFGRDFPKRKPYARLHKS